MKKAEIISVGTELLMGQVANTDAQFISSLLPGAGYAVYYHIVVGDNKERLMKCITESLGRSDLVVLTGGLGPTEDDITKKTAAEVLGLKLVEDVNTTNELKDFFCSMGRELLPSNLSQAYFPENSIILKNCFGTAPGCLIRKEIEGNMKTLILLPGPPSELNPMFEYEALPLIKDEKNDVLKSAFSDIVGVPESAVEHMLQDIITGKTNPTVATYVKEGVVTVRVSASGSEEEAARLIEQDATVIRERFGSNLASETRQNMAEVFVRLCEREKLTFSCAESCTGGMIAEMVTSVPGASNVLKSSFVTYSNESKVNLLGVSEDIIERYGAVSEQTAYAMAENTAAICGTDLAVSSTGNAGPGVLEDKPAGLVYIGVSFRGTTRVERFVFKGSRDHVRKRASNMAFNLARKMILGL